MKIIFWLLLSLSIGCAKAPEPRALMLNTGATGTIQYQITSKPIDEDTVQPIAGTDMDSIITIVTVPASSVPTKVTIVEKKKTLRQSIFRKKKESDKPIEVISDNPNATAEFIEQKPWWEYVAWIVGILSPIIIILNIFADKFGWLLTPLKSLAGFVFKKRR